MVTAGLADGSEISYYLKPDKVEIYLVRSGFWDELLKGRSLSVPRSATEEHMNAETETAIQNLSKAFADTADLLSTMKRIANSLVNIELHLQAMRPSNVQTVRGPTR